VKNIVLKVENVSKQYRLGVFGTGTLSHDINRWWHLVRGKEDPYLKIGENNDRATKGNSDYVFALKNINFEVEQGEVLGVIGKNGAGKSTLLKLLSSVTTPSEGKITMKGRVASLLEVGTGFHPELTGRENVFLNGAILGMAKKEITSKLDEIVEFSGCERYIDTPVKRYSSGMKVRLAFAVAAFLEPEILIVDEVLAVGDAEFQKKAIGKMQDVSKQGGRTVLFVSHNMNAIKTLCTRCIVLKNGELTASGPADLMVQEYLNAEQKDIQMEKSWPLSEAPGNEVVKVIGYKIYSGSESNRIEVNKDLYIKVKFQSITENSNRRDVSLHVYNADNVLACVLSSIFEEDSYSNQGVTEIGFKLPQNQMNLGNYSCTLRIIESKANSSILKINDFLGFTVLATDSEVFYDIGGVYLPKFEIFK
jgi:lipopolysaccharide transport system ATP-binding protein